MPIINILYRKAAGIFQFAVPAALKYLIRLRNDLRRGLSVGVLWPSSMVNRFLHLFFGRSGKAKPHGFLKIGPVIGDKIEGAFTALQQVVTGIRGISTLQQYGIAAFPGNIIGEAQGIGAKYVPKCGPAPACTLF